MSFHLRTVVIPFKPWFNRIGQFECEGILCDLFEYLAESLNFTYDIIQDKEFGILNETDNSWSGVFGRFQRNVT